MKTIEKKRLIRDMFLLSISMVMGIVGFVGILLQDKYPQFGYLSGWFILEFEAALTIYMIYLNEVAFKRANVIAWLLIIMGMAGTAQLLLILLS